MQCTYSYTVLVYIPILKPVEMKNQGKIGIAMYSNGERKILLYRRTGKS